MTGEIEPLMPELWFRRVELIARGHLGSDERSLRHAAHLLQIAPEPLREFVGLAVDEDVFEALLEVGDLDAAARFIVAQPSALSVEEADGVFSAIIRCTALNRSIHGTGDTGATAVLDAWTKCLFALRDKLGGSLLTQQGQSPLLTPSELPPRASLH